MHFYNLMINLFEPLAMVDTTETNSLPDGGTSPLVALTPRDIVTSSKFCMESLIRLYYLRHGFEHWDAVMVSYLLFVAFNALKDLTSAVPTTYNAILSTVVLCAKGLRDQSRNYYIAEAILTLLRDSMDPENVHVLREFAKIDNEEERKNLVAQQVKSVYPINIVSIADDPEKQRLDTLVQAYTEFSLDDNTASESGVSTP